MLSKAPNSANANNTNAVLLDSSNVLCLYGYGYIREAIKQWFSLVRKSKDRVCTKIPTGFSAQ